MCMHDLLFSYWACGQVFHCQIKTTHQSILPYTLYTCKSPYIDPLKFNTWALTQEVDAFLGYYDMYTPTQTRIIIALMFLADKSIAKPASKQINEVQQIL